LVGTTTDDQELLMTWRNTNQVMTRQTKQEKKCVSHETIAAKSGRIGRAKLGKKLKCIKYPGAQGLKRGEGCIGSSTEKYKKKPVPQNTYC